MKFEPRVWSQREFAAALIHDAAMQGDLPSGTVTFLFTDVEGSTKLLHELGPEGYAAALAEHRRVLREAFTRHGGVEVDTQGDAFFVAFPTAPGALRAAAEALTGLAPGPIRVRMGIHTGTPHLAEEGYVGGDVHRAARIAAAGHGGQVLVSASTAQLVELELRDLGEHRFKDLAAPERVYQLGGGDFPALKSLYRTNLPVPATPFLGRERELAEVVELLTRNDLRLLTLTGPGGTGKTRLALQAAAEASESFPDGTYWVPLAPLRDPSLVLSSLAQTLAVKEEPDRPLEDTLGAHLAGKRLLLVLDNLEHLLPQAAAAIAALRDANGSSLLVTSRERLRIGGEQTWPVPPLAEEDGRALFAARARAVEPSFTATPAVDELCARLDELPLAIELAAARTAVFSSEQLLERLSQRLDLLKGDRDADPRQQTLRATIEWSHDLLSQEERRLFRRLSVFVGGCTYEAAEQVADADPDTLQSLLDKSLLRKRDTAYEPRYWMLETIREYAGERLRDGDEEAVMRDRHLDYFVELSERAYGERLASESTWSPIMGAEHDNIRAALDWARDRRPEAEARLAGAAEAEARLAGAVAPYWMRRGRAPEALDRLRNVLERYERRDRIRARVLTHRGELEDDLSHLGEALDLWLELGDAEGEALALESIGWGHDSAGNYAAAQAAHEHSLDVRRQAGAPEHEGASSRAGLCHVLIASGEVERAEAMARELLRTAKPEASLMQQLGLHFLADCSLVAGDHVEAERRYFDALAYGRSAGLVGRCTDEVIGVAMSIAGQGDAARAVRLAAAAYAEQEAIGKGSDHWWSKMQEWFIGGARAQLLADELEQAERSGRETSFEAVLDELLRVPE